METGLVIEYWHWLVLGFLLLGAETFGVGGFLIGMAVAAFALAVLRLFLSLSWENQLIIYAFCSAACTWVYWQYFRNFNQQSDKTLLNDRAAQLIGRSVVLDKALVGGEGKIQIGDTLWKVKSSVDCNVGDTLEVIATEGMTLVLGEQKPD